MNLFLLHDLHMSHGVLFFPLQCINCINDLPAPHMFYYIYACTNKGVFAGYFAIFPYVILENVQEVSGDCNWSTQFPCDTFYTHFGDSLFGRSHRQTINIASKASYTRARRVVRELLANGSWTKCAYVWTGLLTCAAPSVNGSHTVCRKPKFVVFFCANTKRTECAGCPFHASGVLCSPQVCRKLINCVPLTRRTWTVQCVSGVLVYTKLNLVLKF